MRLLNRLLCCVLLAACSSTHDIRRITDAEASRIRAGMTIEEVRAMIGRPWQLVLSPLDPSREVHRYVMKRSTYETMVPRYRTIDGHRQRVEDVPADWTQYRVMELTYLDGVLQAPR